MIHVQLRNVKELRRKHKTARKIKRAVSMALERFSHAIGEVRLSVVDINGPRGGLDKLCRVILRLRPGGMVVATAHGTSPEHAANEALRTLTGCVTRTMSRRRKRSRRGSSLYQFHKGEE